MALSGRERIPTVDGGLTIAASMVLDSSRRVPVLGDGSPTSKGTNLLTYPDYTRIPLAVAGLWITVGDLRSNFGGSAGHATGAGAGSGAGVSVSGGGGGDGNGFEREDGSGVLLLESGDILLLEAA